MKIQKRYIACALIVVLLALVQFNIHLINFSRVEVFRGANLENDVFNPLIASSMNESEAISIVFNNEEVVNNDYVILSNDLAPMLSEDFIKDYLGGTVFRTTEEDFTMQFFNDVFFLSYDSTQANYNNNPITLSYAPLLKSGKTYVSAEDICSFLDGSMDYDMESGTFVLGCKEASLPKRYSLRDYNRTGEVYNQGKESSCWAYAAVSALESTIMPFENRSFSVEDMLNNSGFNDVDSGDYTMALAYLLSWKGPYDVENETVSNHLQKALFFDEGEIDAIKAAVFKYGGVTTSIYANIATSNLNTSNYYNNLTNSYYYDGTEAPNHEVVIIGWDDNYSASNFNGHVTENGAFICQNSWGKSFGQNGAFYVSYQDATIGTQGVCYAGVESNTNYDNIYQYDMYGWVGQVGYSRPYIYGANIFKAASDETLNAAGFYALTDNTSYQIYVVENFDDTASFAKKKLITSGEIENAGYYTINFPTPVELSSSEQFAVVIYLNSPQTDNPMALEYQNDRISGDTDLFDGYGYISKNGLDWERTETTCSANLCIKAYTKNVAK